MVSEGERTPTIPATEGTRDHEPFDLEAVLGDGPVVLDEAGEVASSWEADEPTTEPDYEAVLEAVESVWAV